MTILGFFGMGFMTHRVSRSLILQPDRSKRPPSVGLFVCGLLASSGEDQLEQRQLERHGCATQTPSR
jgi:hypothetical protein